MRTSTSADRSMPPRPTPCAPPRAPDGLTVRVAEREVVPHLVRLLVDRGLSVYGAAAKAPTLEDVYFAVEARIAASEGRPAPAPTGDLVTTPVGSFS